MNTSHNKILLKHLTFTRSFIYIKIYAHEAVHVHVYMKHVAVYKFTKYMKDIRVHLKKVCSHNIIVNYPDRWTVQRALHGADFSGKHFSHAAITREDYPLTFPPPY